jgi:NADPH:quinone reductase-like Zn-dependent oxidoreductase
MITDERAREGEVMRTGTTTMRAVRLRTPGGPKGLALERIDVPDLAQGEALVRVHAAAITRDELDWPEDRLPATPSYELSGVVTAVAADVERMRVGDAIFALTPFDRDGVAAEFATVPDAVLARKPQAVDHVQAAAVPMAALSAWQGLFVHGRLEAGQRVIVHGAAGGVGHLAVQLAVERAGYVIGTTSSPAAADMARSMGANEVIDSTAIFERGIDRVDLVFDTVGGEVLARSPQLLRRGGRLVTIAEEPPQGVDAIYFVVEPDGEQLTKVADLVDEGALHPAIDSVFPFEEFRAAFERTMVSSKRGKVVLRVIG